MPMPTAKKIIDAQVSSWVNSICKSRQITDPEVISASKRKVKHFILTRMEQQQVGLEGLTPLLAEALNTLNHQLDKSQSQDG